MRKTGYIRAKCKSDYVTEMHGLIGQHAIFGFIPQNNIRLAYLQHRIFIKSSMDPPYFTLYRKELMMNFLMCQEKAINIPAKW